MSARINSRRAVDCNGRGILVFLCEMAGLLGARTGTATSIVLVIIVEVLAVSVSAHAVVEETLTLLVAAEPEGTTMVLFTIFLLTSSDGIIGGRANIIGAPGSH